MQKSQIVQMLLTVFLGPLGLFYSSAIAALVWLVVLVVVGSSTLLIGALLLWPFVVLTGFFTVRKFNQRARLEERRHQEIVDASRGRG